MGAGEVCLTAHHEGGFCLWDTQYSNYSVMHSPYGKDVVAQRVSGLPDEPPRRGSAKCYLESNLNPIGSLMFCYGMNCF